MIPMSETVLKIENLSKTFDEVMALSGVSLEIKSGEFVCLVGPDGAGKTTLIRIICGLERADGGEVELFGRQVRKLSSKERARLGYLSQGFSLYEDLSVEENLFFLAGLYGQGKNLPLINSLLEFTRMTPFRHRLAGQLSGGMKQKLALACTLVHQPDLLLLDEPTTGVDPVSRRDFWQILFNLQLQGKAILMSTPYLDEAERASRVVLIHRGKILAFDKPENLKKQFRARVIELTGPDSQLWFKKLRLLSDFLDVQLFGDRLHLVVPPETQLEEILSLLAKMGVKAEKLEEVSPALEDVFIFLIKKVEASLEQRSH